MRRSIGMLLLPTLVLLACSDTPPTATSVEDMALSNADNPCPTCAFGPRKFVRSQGDRIRVTFAPHTSPIDNCTLRVEDDGAPTTSAQIWLNGAIVVERSVLLGPLSVVQVPVTLLAGSNTIEVAVRGGAGHFVRARIECGTTVTIAPDPVVLSTEKTQQFSVSGAPGPYTWSVNGVDGGNSTFGTIDAAGLYLAPATIPTPATFQVCVRVTSTPSISDCATVTIVPPPTARMVISAGDGQVAQPGSPVLIPPAVLVTRADGSPWPGVEVTFAVASGGGSVTGATTSTGTDGIATVGSWTLGDTPGTNTLTATAAESGIMENPVTFTATGVLISTQHITAGTYTTCGIAAGSQAFCWGGNFLGSIGDGTTILRTAPTPVAGGLSFAAITGGYDHTCGLTLSGLAYCWGSNAYGQVGDGTFDSPRLVPTHVSGGLTFTMLESGTYQACGLMAGGAAYCWGNNTYGRLGDGTTTNRSVPTPVIGGLSFTSVVSGDNHTCGLVSGGIAYCWGLNNAGQVGDGTLTDRYQPTAVAGGHTFTALTLGYGDTCGLTESGEAFCWGLNLFGELGDGSTTDRSLPTPVSGGLRYVSISSGGLVSCGITVAGAAMCWGLNHDFMGKGSGQLGDGTTTDRHVPTAVLGGLNFTAVVPGEAHTCGTVVNGAAYCWGSNLRGQLGIPNTFGTSVLTPTPVVGGLVFLGSSNATASRVD
jgi:alpha-tubulin suppressor-like RCC1 family protein